MNRMTLLASCVLALAIAAVPAFAEQAGNPLALDARAVQDAGIVISRLAMRELAEEIKAPGEVKIDAYSTVLVSPRIESMVLSRKVKLGDVVKAGQPLVVLSSVQVAETQGSLIVAEQEWRRVSSLGPQAVSGRRYTEVQVQRDQARARLRAYGLSDGQIQSVLRAGSAKADGSYELLAPVDGRITTDSFLVGERVDAGRMLFTLVKEDSVWVEARMPPADAERVTQGSAARILIHDQSLPGKVVQRSHQTDEKTRTVPVRIEVDNRRDLLHPGELVDARVAVGGRKALAVPAEAVVLLQNQSTVFLVSGSDAFEPVAVQVGESRDGWVEVRQGLKPGASYVSKGAFALKARLLRSQLGEE
ncbi:efflux RND transporter periplasmic adaptor subunit [Dyella japonica]|uniref:RND transporter n=1 Tax=Dyella japonica A8 TaxID=1217721 RepID=A0A075K3K8_9GAMM|nr:efflux RND transporter periplasmic adaptor subunit [Dyella japonica]AIF48297.1 RND transporter [Dyella japonica A8]